MKQYCRYCSSCHAIDDELYYCNDKEQIMSESQIKRANNCKDYGYCSCGDVITGKQYQPRKLYQKRVMTPPQGEQIELE